MSDDSAGPAVRAVVSAINALVADYRNHTVGRTAWAVEVTGGRVSRIEAGQA